MDASINIVSPHFASIIVIEFFLPEDNDIRFNNGDDNDQIQEQKSTPPDAVKFLKMRIES